MAEQERRRFTRIHFDANCMLCCGDKTWQVKLVDICLKGALVETEEDIPLQIDDYVELIIELDAQNAVIEMPAELNHKVGKHLGFKAKSMNIDGVSHLKRLVELNLGSPELLERELDRIYSHS